jgi:hypothetical protein
MEFVGQLATECRKMIMEMPGQLNPSSRILLGPGPSDVHPRVLTGVTAANRVYAG